MDQFRYFLKDVLQKVNQDNNGNACLASVRMSEIVETSISSEEIVPLHSSTIKNKVNNHGKCSLNSNINNNFHQNDFAAHSPKTDPLHVKLLLNYNDMVKPSSSEESDASPNIKDEAEVREESHKNVDEKKTPEMRRQGCTTTTSESPRRRKGNLRLQVNLPIINDEGEPLAPVNERNCVESYAKIDAKVSPQAKVRTRPRSRVLMGKNVLMKSKEIKEGSSGDDSQVVQQLVLGKYNDVLNHYQMRMYQRRLSRGSQSTDDSTNSPQSISSVTSCGGASCFSFESFEGQNRQNWINYHQLGSKVSCSIDNVNKDTTVEDLEANFEGCLTPRSEESEYDASKFLRDALGDDLMLNNSGCSVECRDTNKNNKISPKSVNTPNISSLISRRASSFCNAVKTSIRRRLSLSMSESRHEVAKKESKILNNNSSVLERLMRDLSAQNEIILQISKALDFCRNKREFLASAEHIEAERILLLASCRKEVLTKEINRVEFDEEPEKDCRSDGTIEISNLHFPVKENSTIIDSHENFVILVSSGTKVLSSRVVTATNGSVALEKTFAFTNLDGHFQVSVAIYSMKVWNSKNHDDSKRHRDTNFISKRPSAKSIFHLHRESSSKIKTLNDVSSFKVSSFLLCGKYDIRTGDLAKTKVFNMYSKTVDSLLDGVFTADIKKEVVLTVRNSGFLTIGIDSGSGCTLWNRRWCLLEGSKLKYWSYPSEESTKPINVIDMADCATQEVAVAERNLCARPRTLLLVVYDVGESVKRYFLSADSLQEMNQWLDDMNYAVGVLRSWHSMNEKEYELMTSL